MFGPGADCKTLGSEYVEDISAKIGLHGYVISVDAIISASDSGNIVTLATSDDVSNNDWDKVNSIELSINNGKFKLSKYGNTVDSPGNKTITFSPLTSYGNVQIRIISFEGSAFIRIIQASKPEKFEILSFGTIRRRTKV